ncbi:MFS transporter [Amycolatopsis dongchuanensis]|uniref:YbfB/YjiJ family MFS transporter n=1 Tax=Amycolatopsis dongchuanensis TaxID=1070866 RepID=A0ABP9PVW9_9PSEU
MVQDRERHWGVVAAAGAGVIAVCYGFARYAFGLFEPRFSGDFHLSGTGVGILGGLSTLGYGIGLLVAPRLAVRSARRTTVLAGALAAAGVALMAASGSVVLFGVGTVIAGSSAGLASPGVAQLVGERVGEGERSRAQTWANTGTSFGLAASAFLPLAVWSWRWTWAGFAVVAVVVTVVAGTLVGRSADRPRETAAQGSRWPDGATRLVASSVILGAASAPYWNFSPARLSDAGISTVLASLCWCAIGLAGPIGGMAGRLAERRGLRWTVVCVWLVWTAGMALLALPRPVFPVALLSTVLFGIAYMGLTGLCILWAGRLFEDVSRGVTLSFLGLAAGQTAASPVAGALGDAVGLGPVFGGAALASLVALLLLPREEARVAVG